MANWSQKGKFPSFKFQEISVSQTLNLIGKLSNSNSLGTDDIDSIAIKQAAVQLAPPIRHIVNTSLKTSIYANKWKISKLVPLLKSKELNRMSPSSFRPIAILPSLSKIVEKTAQLQILQYMETSSQMNRNLHAYRKNHGTTTAMIDITDRLYEAVDEKQVSTIMTIDQSAAFDCVPFDVLIGKLRLYNLGEQSINWIQSYLTYRTQFVKIGRASSRMFAVERGVPQGSVLGPLLYSLYVNEMTEAIIDPNCRSETHRDNSNLFNVKCEQCGNVTLYADDATYHVSSKHRDYNQQKLEENSTNLRTYLNSNKMTINMDKTKLLEVMIKQRRCKTGGNPPQLIVTNSENEQEVIKNSKNIRILGMNLQGNFTWNAHLESGSKPLLPSLRRNLGLLKSQGRKNST